MTTNVDMRFLARMAAIRRSGLFDEAEYEFRDEAAQLGQDPVHHYLASGEDRGGKPSRRFDPIYYQRKYGRGESPLLHYIYFGKERNNRTLPVVTDFEMSVTRWRDGYSRALVLMPDHSDSDGISMIRRILDRLIDKVDVIGVSLDELLPSARMQEGLAGLVHPIRKIPRHWKGSITETSYFVSEILERFSPHAVICCGNRGRVLAPRLSSEFLPVVTLSYDQPLPQETDRMSLYGYSTSVWFSSESVKDQHMECYPWLGSRRTGVAPLLSETAADTDAVAEAILSATAEAQSLAAEIANTFSRIGRMEKWLKEESSMLFQPDEFSRRLRDNCIVGGLSTGGAPAFPVPRMLIGFDVARYMSSRPLRRGNPVLDYAMERRPVAFRRKVIDIATPPRSSVLRAALHGHFYHTDTAQEFLDALSINQHPIDLFLSTDSQIKADELGELVRERALTAEIRALPNKGRDLGAFFTGFRDLFDGRFDVIGHIHGKKSEHKGTKSGDSWRRYLLESTVGGRNSMADRVISAFNNDDRLGLVFPEHDEVRGWDHNLNQARLLMSRMGISHNLDVPLFDFPAGSFFWCRPLALRPILSMDMSWDDYPSEPLSLDGTILHALERLLVHVCMETGYGIATTCVLQDD